MCVYYIYIYTQLYTHTNRLPRCIELTQAIRIKMYFFTQSTPHFEHMYRRSQQNRANLSPRSPSDVARNNPWWRRQHRMQSHILTMHGQCPDVATVSPHGFEPYFFCGKWIIHCKYEEYNALSRVYIYIYICVCVSFVYLYIYRIKQF